MGKKVLKYTLNVPIADLVCQLIVENKKYFEKIRLAYIYKDNSDTIDYTIQIEKTNFLNPFIEHRTKHFLTFYFPYKKFNLITLCGFIESSLSYLISPKNVFLFHASSVKINGKGYVFCGASGAGKSTIIRLSKNIIPLSDDTTIIRKLGNHFFIYSSPFDKNRFKFPGFDSIPLAKIFILHQSDKTQISSLPVSTIVQRLLENNFMFFPCFLGTQNDKDIFFRFSLDLVSSIPVQKLYFTKSQEFLKYIDE